MFEHWRLKGHNKKATAKEFGVGYFTVVRISSADNWLDREKAIADRAREIANEKIAIHEFDRVAKVRECLKHEIEAYLARVKAGEIQGSLSTIILAMRYLDERDGTIPPPNQPAHVDINLQLYLTPSSATPEEAKGRIKDLVEILSESNFGG